jgi:hypothetical protein
MTGKGRFEPFADKATVSGSRHISKLLLPASRIVYEK